MDEIVTMIVHGAPISHGYPMAMAEIVDTPEHRAWLETQAIPRCHEWRLANPECNNRKVLDSLMGTDFPPCNIASHLVPAPYCCSAYCARCAGLRALAGDPEITPNEWMTNG